MKKEIETPIGNRQVPPEVIELFQTLPTKPVESKPPKYILGDRVYEWMEENGKLVTKTYRS